MLTDIERPSMALVAFFYHDDVVHSEFNDRRIDAMDMDISDNDLSVIYAQNVFHHIPAPEKSLSEPDRIQKQGGGIILIEPFCGALAAFIYSKFITEEIFDKKQVGWSSDHKGPMLGENQALSYIVFKRDRDIFEKKFPQFQIVETAVLPNYMRYILSGGLNFRQLIPLAPFLFVAWILRRRFFVGVSDGMPDLQKPPHSGKLLYEKRSKYEWRVFARKAIEASR